MFDILDRYCAQYPFPESCVCERELGLFLFFALECELFGCNCSSSSCYYSFAALRSGEGYVCILEMQGWDEGFEKGEKVKKIKYKKSEHK